MEDLECEEMKHLFTPTLSLDTWKKVLKSNWIELNCNDGQITLKV